MRLIVIESREKTLHLSYGSLMERKQNCIEPFELIF